MEIEGLPGGIPNLNEQAKTRGFQELSTEDFMKILIAELSNQNPLEPMENQQLLQQVTSINSLASNRILIDTLQNMTAAQSLGSASSLIGKTVSGVIGDQTVTGTVEKALVEDGRVFLMIGDVRLPMENVTEISGTEEEPDTAD